MSTKIATAAALGIAGLLATASPALATQIFTNGSTTINGTTFGFGTSAAPWTAEIFATPGQCLRLEVTSQATDLEMVVVAPNGSVFRNDDGGGSFGLRPVVKVNNTPNNGWYTVSINNFAGNAVSSNFGLNIQRLGVNSASCLPATTPTLATTAAGKSTGRSATARPAAGEPGS